MGKHSQNSAPSEFPCHICSPNLTEIIFLRLPSSPPNKKRESGRKENNRCHFRVALGFFSLSLMFNPLHFFLFFLIITQTKGTIGVVQADTLRHGHICSKLCLKGADYDSGHDTRLSECLSALTPPRLSLSPSLTPPPPVYSVSSQTSDGSVTRINNPVGPGFNLN